MSNDMPDVIYANCNGTSSSGFIMSCTEAHLDCKIKYYSESHVQQLIKEAEQRQRKIDAAICEEVGEKYEDEASIACSVCGCSILNAGGE